jgi:hypothetical protein
MAVQVRWVTAEETVYRSLTNIRVLTLQDTLEGDDVLTGFDVPVQDLFI